MHLHIISSLDPKDFKNSNIASYRLRLSYIKEAAEQIGYEITGGVNINNKADIFYIGKITKDIEVSVLHIIQNLKKNSRILVDYTDDLLDSNNDINRRKIYEELMKIEPVVIVPVKGLGTKLNKIVKKTFVIPDGIDNIPIINPFKKNNTEINVLWNGHSSNINSLIRLIDNDLINYKFNLHIVSNQASFQILNTVNFKSMPKCFPISHLWSIKKLLDISKKCDFAILPSDKIWASANRLVTNFRLGLPVIAETINSYKPYSDYYCNFEKKNVSNMFKSQEKWYELVKQAQKKTQEDFNYERLVSMWKEFLNNI